MTAIMFSVSDGLFYKAVIPIVAHRSAYLFFVLLEYISVLLVFKLSNWLHIIIIMLELCFSMFCVFCFLYWFIYLGITC